MRRRYRVTAVLTNGADGARSSWLVGTSNPVRRDAAAANPNLDETPMRGLYAEYSKSGTFVSSRIEPAPYDGWRAGGQYVYPASQGNGLLDYYDFEQVQNGGIIVDRTGMYYFTGESDASYIIAIGGVEISRRGNAFGGLQVGASPVWLEAGRSYPIRLQFTETDGEAKARLRFNYGAATSNMQVAPQKFFYSFPMPWAHMDTSEEGRGCGNARYAAGTRAFTVYSYGMGCQDSRDDVHYVWQDADAAMNDMIATVSALSAAGGGAAPSAGLMYRDGAGEDARMFGVEYAVGGSGPELRLVSRGETGGALARATLAADGLALPCRLRLSRRSGECRVYYDCDGKGWISPTNAAIAASEACRAGFFAASGRGDSLATAFFSEISYVGNSHAEISSATASNGKITIAAVSNDDAIRKNIASNALAYSYWCNAMDASRYCVFRSDGKRGRAWRGDEIGRIIPPAASYVDTVAPSNAVILYRVALRLASGAMADGSEDPNALVAM